MSALTLDAVGELFSRLMAIYGTRFTSTYAGQDPMAVRMSWLQELRGVGTEGVDYALDHLPADHPPNVLQFRSIAQAAPKPVERVEQAPAPMASPERVRSLLGPRMGLGGGISPVTMWQRVLQNPRSTRTAREMAETALRNLQGPPPARTVDEIKAQERQG